MCYIRRLSRTKLSRLDEIVPAVRRCALVLPFGVVEG